MTNLEKREALSDFCRGRFCTNCKLSEAGLSCGRGKAFSMSYKGTDAYMTDDEIDAAYAIAFPGDTTAHIKDSGDRTEFSTGAVRDVREGKGRCDLMPLDVVARCYQEIYDDDAEQDSIAIGLINDFMQSGKTEYLYDLITNECAGFTGLSSMFLEVSKHFEEGAKKYGVDNWKKGIPVWCYIDSAVRHYLKWLRGDDDEHHDRAFVWNIMCAIWTCEHKTELNDYAKNQEDDGNA